MGGSGSGTGLGCVGLTGLLPGSQLQTDGAVPCSALLLLLAGEEFQTGPDGARVSLIVCVLCFLSSALNSCCFSFYIFKEFSYTPTQHNQMGSSTLKSYPFDRWDGFMLLL